MFPMQGASIGMPMVPEGNSHSKSLRVFPAEVISSLLTKYQLHVGISQVERGTKMNENLLCRLGEGQWRGKTTTSACVRLHSQNCTTCSGLLKTALNNVLLPTLFNVVNKIAQHCCA